MEFRIADTFTDSLARLTGDEQKAGLAVNSGQWLVVRKSNHKALAISH